MPKIRKLKRSKKFKANINRKRLRNKMRKLPDIECKDIKTAWENTKSTRQNLGDMGLAYDPNESLKIPNSKREIIHLAKHQNNDNYSESEDEKNVKRIVTKGHVALSLEAEAKAPRDRMFRLPKQQVQFVTYLMDKYADDYKAMARDKKNYYQMTWRQIRAKINTFKGIPEQYAEYLIKNGDIVLDDPTSLVETRKKIAEENVKKFCAPKQKKIKPIDQQETEDDIDFDTGDKLEDLNDEDNAQDDGTNENTEKKLQLFSDDDNDDNENETKKLCIKKSKVKLDIVKDKKTLKRNVKNVVEMKKTKGIIVQSEKKAKNLEILPSSDSESEEELEEDENDETGFVDLNELDDEEISEDDILDNGEFVTDSDESD